MQHKTTVATERANVEGQVSVDRARQAGDGLVSKGFGAPKMGGVPIKPTHQGYTEAHTSRTPRMPFAQSM